MMNEGITMKQVHTPQSVPPPLPLMFVWRSARAPFPSLPGDGEPARSKYSFAEIKGYLQRHFAAPLVAAEL